MYVLWFKGEPLAKMTYMKAARRDANVDKLG
jgi:hypothetical protein